MDSLTSSVWRFVICQHNTILSSYLMKVFPTGQFFLLLSLIIFKGAEATYVEKVNVMKK